MLAATTGESLNDVDVAPLICEACGAISLLLRGSELRKPTQDELAAIKRSPAWRDVLEPVSRMLAAERARRS
ncbi:MAG TPA: hypothetical protein VIV56_07160 [Gemmatimonadales bacterium]